MSRNCANRDGILLIGVAVTTRRPNAVNIASTGTATHGLTARANRSPVSRPSTPPETEISIRWCSFAWI